MSVIVYVSASNGKVSKTGQEATYYASQVAAQVGGNVIAVAVGEVSNLEALGNFGATKVLAAKGLSDADAGQLTKAVAQAVAENDASVVVLSLDPKGKELAPRLSARLKAGLVTGAVELPSTDGGFSVKKKVFFRQSVSDC